jgi:hypothetical protein
MMVEEEWISEGQLAWKRIPCPGGWVYTAFDKNFGVGGITFVPDQEGNQKYNDKKEKIQRDSNCNGCSCKKTTKCS